MKVLFTLALLIASFTLPLAKATTVSKLLPAGMLTPVCQSNKPPAQEKLTARRLSFIQRLKLKIAYYTPGKRREAIDTPLTAKQAKQAKWSLILGICSIVLLVIPYVGLLSIPAAVTGLILGIKSLKGNSNTKGLIGIITSSVALLLLILSVMLFAIFLSHGW